MLNCILHFILSLIVACTENGGSGQDSNTDNGLNLSEMRLMLENLRDQATTYAETLRQSVFEQSNDTYTNATEYARRIEEIAADAESLNREECRERLEQLRTAFFENPALGGRIMASVLEWNQMLVLWSPVSS